MKAFLDGLESIGRECFARRWTSVGKRLEATSKRLMKYDASKELKRQRKRRERLRAAIKVVGLL